MSLIISEYLDNKNLHHAYLIEGEHEKITPQILSYLENLGIKTTANPDFCHITIDFLKIKEALDLRSIGSEKSLNSGKRIFVLSVNRFSPDAQGVLLKIFEEPIQNTHFFIITPDINVLTKTLLSRFYVIRSPRTFENEMNEASKFISLSIKDRINFIKEFLADIEEAEETENSNVEISAKSKALRFLNAVEYALHKKFLFESKPKENLDFFEQIFKTREFLRQQGSSVKTLLESVALTIPTL